MSGYGYEYTESMILCAQFETTISMQWSRFTVSVSEFRGQI